MKSSILIIDDEKNIRRSVEMICTGEGYSVTTAPDGETALQMFDDMIFDLVLLDVQLPGIDGLEVLQQIRKDYSEVQVIMISGHATIQTALQAARQGAYDFIEKPISKDKLLIAVSNAIRNRALQKENIALRKQVSGRFEMIGESRAIQDIRDQITRVAPTNGRVLISGESGTGKELIARAIHENSLRKAGPFIKVNCAAIPEELIESELFGSEKGAYTGAHTTREGKFSQADNGTLFLDEVGDMSLKVQAKVLRVLQEGEFEKVGGQKNETVDVRVLAASNKDLEAECKTGTFREDLFFRLNVVPLLSPPLRRRRDDIPVLVEHFVSVYVQENGLRSKRVTPEAMQALRAYNWPGNIRELKNLVERLLIMCSAQDIELSDLPQHIHSPASSTELKLETGLTLKEARESVEQQVISVALSNNNWNISRAARELDIDRTNLHKKINYYGITEK